MAADLPEGQRLSRREIYKGRTFGVEVDQVRLPNGKEVEMEIVRHRGAAAVIPLLDDGTVIFVRQYRYATGGWLLEIPAGKLDGSESPETCARREVEEEAGYTPGKLEPLGWIWATPGFADEKIHLFLATDLEATPQRLEEDEVLHIERIPLQEAIDLATNGDFHDSKSICALLRLARARKL
ncbi:MAG TPA: NUDIX hydrolase [Thermoanaerobaculia bacterium]|jgi:ADP-ribose pyrophosphatase